MKGPRRKPFILRFPPILLRAFDRKPIVARSCAMAVGRA